MNKLLPILLLASTTTFAGTYEWTAGWGMGVSEYMVDDGNGNELNISCPSDEEQGLAAYATINGKSYSFDQGGGFDVIVDGEIYSNPFFTNCRACDANFPFFWEALRKANNLLLSAEGQAIRLPTRNIGQVLEPLDSPTNSCWSAW